MDETYLLKHPGVKKRILHGGQGPLPHFPSGTKLVFHFQTLLDNFERTVIDDSRRNKVPTEIFVGKMFKMEVWEVLLTSMRIGEVAEFWCDAIHTGLYPIVSKGMRLAAQGKDPLHGQKHMCGMGNVFTYHSTGFPELDELMREPQPLIFIMELISVGDPLTYHRESWLMDKDEKMKMVPSLHLQGNSLVRQGCYREASEKYKEAVLLLRVVQSREMPGDEDYINLGRLIIPLVLNYCQCMLELEDYYEVIKHTTELIEKHKDCVKAYYKRAKAYTAVWSEREAKRDFLMVANLDVTLARLVQKELKFLSERIKEKYWEDKERYWNILEEKEKKTEDASEEKAEENLNEDPQCLQQEVTEENASAPEKNKPGSQSEEEETRSEVSVRMAALIEGKDRQQMLRLLLLLQDEGTFQIKERHYAEAMVKFKEALDYVDYIQTKEVEYKGEDWESLEKVRLPLTLNLSQCKFELGEYQEVVKLNSKLLTNHKDNLKAIYQRARAHAALYNEDEARRDFSRVLRLDPKLKPIVQQELKNLGTSLRSKNIQEKKNYWTSSQEKWEKKAKNKKGSKAEKKEVKWADESKTGGESCVLVKDVGGQAKTANSDKVEESMPSLPGSEEGQDEKTESLGREQAACPDLNEGSGELDDDKSVGNRGCLDQAEDGTQILDIDSKVREVSLMTAQEEATAEKTGQSQSTSVKAETICPAGAREPGSDGGPSAGKGASLPQQINRPGCAESKKGQATSRQRMQAKTTAGTASRAPPGRSASKNAKHNLKKK